MDIKRMVLSSWYGEEVKIRFKYYGDFDTLKLLHNDCKEDMFYLGNSSLDGAPIFVYVFKKFDEELLYDNKKLNFYLRELKLRKITKNDLSEQEKSILLFLRFFMYNLENSYIKGVSEYEINYTSTSS